MGLREERRKQRLSLEAVAYLADNLDPATVSRIERGLVTPRPETVVKLARALNMSVSRFRELMDTETAGAAP